MVKALLIKLLLIAALASSAKAASMDVTPRSRQGKPSASSLIVFVSLGMPHEALVQLLRQAKAAHAEVAIRGLWHDSFQETYRVLQGLVQETDNGVTIDPEAFTRYHVAVVPTVVITQGKQWVSARGNVSLSYALHRLKQELPYEHQVANKENLR